MLATMAGRDAVLAPTERAFVEAARRAVLATLAPDGRPRLVPVCFVLAGPPGPSVALSHPDLLDRPRVYTPLDEKPKRSRDPHSLARVRDLLARPAAALLVDRWDEDWGRLGWIRLDGHGELVEPGSAPAEHAAAVAALRLRYPPYRAQALEERPLIRLTVDRVVAWGNLEP